MEKGQGKGTDTLHRDNDYLRRGDVKCLLENVVCLHEELPAQIDLIPAADVVARDCFDKILAENDDMRATIDTYGGLENIQSAFVKLHKIENADVVPVVRCGECKHRDPEDKKCDCGGLEHAHMFPVADDWFCADGEKREVKHENG